MNKVLFTGLLSMLLLCTTQLFAHAPQIIEGKKIYKVVEQMPMYNGGVSALMQFIGDTIATAGINAKGKAMFSFVVGSNGAINDIHVLRSISDEVDEICTSAIKATEGNWTPGRQDGEAVAVRFMLPIKFKK